MKKMLLFVVAFLLLMAVIFGMTLIGEMTGNDSTKKETVSASKKIPVGEIFKFRTSEVNYDPKSDELQKQFFRGFFEEGDEDTVQFWFDNRSPVPISVSAGASCVSCSGARIANVTDEMLGEYARTMGVGGLASPMLAGAINPFMITAAMNLDARLPWQTFDLTKPNGSLEFAGTRVGDKYGKGVLQMKIKASRTSSSEPKLTLRMSIPDEPESMASVGLKYFYTPSAFAIRPGKQDLGELSELTPSRTFDLIAWSPVRSFGDQFPPQTVKPEDDRIPVVVSVPERISRIEMDDLAAKISEEMKIPTRVAGAYRYRAV
jgi:hypothetical protein